MESKEKSTMIILLVIILINVISAEDTDDKFIDTLPEKLKKAFLEKVSRRIREEVPEVESGEEVRANVEVIEGKLEEQGDFVKKILQEEMDSLKARRQNLDGHLFVPEYDSYTVKNTKMHNRTHFKRVNNDATADKSNESLHQVDLTLRPKSKRAVEEAGDGQKGLNGYSNTSHVNGDKTAAIEEDNTDKAKSIRQNMQSNYNILKESNSIAANYNVSSTKTTTNQSNEAKKPIMNMTPDKHTNPNVDTTGFLTAETKNTAKNALVDVTEKAVNLVKIAKPEVINDEPINANDITEIASAKSPKLREYLLRVDNKTDRPLINNKNNIGEFQGKKVNSKIIRFKIKNVTNSAQNIMTTVKLTSDIPKINIVKGNLTNISTSSDPGTENSMKETMKSEIIGKDSKHKSSKTVPRLETRNNTKDVNNKKSKAVLDKVMNLHTKTPYNNTNILKEENKLFNIDKPNMLISDKKQSSSEHFGNLKTVKGPLVNEEDKAKLVQRSSKDNEDQPHYYPVYNYEPNNVHFNVYNRLGPNVDDVLDKHNSIPSLREHKQDINGQHSPASVHYGDLQVAKEYEVFEVDPKSTSFIRENKNASSEEPQYYSVYNYDPKQAYFNAFNRLGPNDSEENKRDSQTSLESTVAVDDKEMLKLRSIEVNTKVPLNENVGRKETDGFHEQHMPVSVGSDHPFQVANNGLKSRLEATRHTLLRNKVFGYVPSDQERSENNDFIPTKTFFRNDNDNFKDVFDTLREDASLLRKSEDMSYTDWESSYETHRDTDLSSDSENLSKDTDSRYLSKYPFNFNKDRAKQLLVDMKEKGIIDSIEQIEIMDQLQNWGKNKNSQFGIFLKEGNDVTSHVHVKDKGTKSVKVFLTSPASRFKIKSRADIEVRPENLEAVNEEINVDSEESRQNEPYMINNIEERINLSPPLDMNIVTAMRAENDELEIHLKILKDMVTMDHPALEKYDWLGTTVDIRSALTKLLDLIRQSRLRRYIHPEDLQLLKYTKTIFKTARRITLEREEEISDDEEYNKSGKLKTVAPKTHRKIPNPLKIINKMYKVRTVDEKRKTEASENLEEFLRELQNGLNDFHILIKHISRITKYKTQRWYKNIRELYLVKPGRKEYLEILLHLFLTRFFGLIEESSMNGAKEDYKAYVKKNRAAVDRTEAEVMFILKILKAINKLRN